MLRVFEDGRRSHHGRTAHYAQLCKALLDLQDAADKIFDTISRAVSTEHRRLKGLSNRIRTAKVKVDAISGTKRAITIKSCSRYPSVCSETEDFQALFGGKVGGVRTDFPVATLLLNGGLSRECREDGTLELFRFFSETTHETLSTNNNGKSVLGCHLFCFTFLENTLSKCNKVGIGNMHHDVNSVADILLFNSTELPYHSYKIVDNLVGGEPTLLENSSELQPTPLPPPPQSVLQGSMLSSMGLEDFGFRPTLRQVPSFSLPSTLPDLPMVADISWSGSKSGITMQSSVAPSVVSSAAPTNDGTMLKSNSGSVQGQDEDSSLSLASEHDSFSQKSCSSNEDAPNRFSNLNKPVTSITSIHTMDENTNDKGISALPVLTIPLPAPPPPPPMAPWLTSDSSSKKEDSIMESGGLSPPINATSRNPPLPQIDSRRAALLASIRDPGIVLKKTGLADYSKSSHSFVNSTINDANVEGSNNAIVVPKPKSVNLLAEMAASLKMRRLSMQGAAHDKDQITARADEQLTNLDAMSPSTSSTKFALPISNLHAYIAQRNEEASEEEDWED